jgi:hypothetical protein
LACDDGYGRLLQLDEADGMAKGLLALLSRHPMTK